MLVDLWLGENPCFDLKEGDLYKIIYKDGRIACLERIASRAYGIIKLDEYMELDFDMRELRRFDEIVYLTSTEWKVLQCLSEFLDCVVPWYDICQRVWGFNDNAQILRVIIWRLRKKLGDTHPGAKSISPSGKYIQTYENIGYRLHPQVK